MNKKYKHLFFDLDRTLWDFDTNNLITFRELYRLFDLYERGITDFDHLFGSYMKINKGLWEDYRNLIICREDLNFRRFYESLLLFGLDDHNLACEMGACYLQISPLQTGLYPETIETLEKLHQKYQMHIITNGFEEVQYIKIENCGLSKYFDKIITSERAGYKKPDCRIFEFALREANAVASECLIIGDDPEADIFGGCQAGIDQIWVKHYDDKKAITQATFEVSHLRDIVSYL